MATKNWIQGAIKKPGALRAELGVKAICIGVSHPCVKESETFSFGPFDSLFCEGEFFGRPVAWELAGRIGARNSCGNSDQYQIGSGWPKSAWTRRGSLWTKVA